MGLGSSWRVVYESYRKIVEFYERANLLVTFGNVDRWRREAINLFYQQNGKNPLRVLDAGAGPGNMARHIRGQKYVVALDATAEMLRANDVADEKVVGLFEYMPFRSRCFDVVLAGYSLHAAVDFEKAVAEFSRVAEYQVVVSIGKPDNIIARGLLYLYTKYILPRLACIVAPRGVCDEYGKIFTIVKSQMHNSATKRIIEKYTTDIVFKTRGLGGVYIYVAKSKR